MSVPTLLLPVGGITLLWVAGLGAADFLGRRLPHQASVALAVPLAAAVLVCTSPLARSGVPPPVLGLAVLAILGAATALRVRRLRPVVPRAALPAPVAAGALAP